MKLLSWNILRGGGARASRLVAAITAHDPDVIALAEFRTKPGVALCGAIQARGWPYVESSKPQGNDNGLCLLSRTPLRCTRLCPVPPEHAVRWLEVDLPEHGFGIGLLHIICAGHNENQKAHFWDAVLAQAAARRAEPYMLIGDFNTGAHRLDEIGKTFHCAEHFQRLSTIGWMDLWRHHNPGVTEYTWFSKLRGGALGNGFRVDHAFATPCLVPRVKGCRYSHAERERSGDMSYTLSPSGGG
jgi:exodeoxyribonuclease-3